LVATCKSLSGTCTLAYFGTKKEKGFYDQYHLVVRSGVTPGVNVIKLFCP
jgi:hypothetical protein